MDDMMMQQQAAKIVLDSPNIVCECGCNTFLPAVALKKVSSIVSPSGKEEVIDVPVYICSKCGAIPQWYKDKPNFAKIFGEDIKLN